jgi:hypothetical protein
MGDVTYIDWQQKRGAALDAIDEAISAYEGFMLDDDFDYHGCLDRIMKRLIERREQLGTK